MRRSLDQLRRTGKVTYAFLGVTTQELYPQLARRLGVGAARGALVVSVEAGSPGQRAGIVAGTRKIAFESERGIPTGGDVITAVDGHPVVHSADLTDLIGLQRPGARVTLSVVRGRAHRSVAVTLTPRPNRPGAGGG
ncbi:MAG: hypothetical protein NVSMB29_11520 [Candidatus Dormibacteria bacterium]